MNKDLLAFLTTDIVRKLVCGAGNEDAEYVYKLVKLFSLAGWKYFDISPKKDVILAAKKALDENDVKGFINVSFGIKGDPHTNKAIIDYNQCTSCGSCIAACPNNAIIQNEQVTITNKCIGCARCISSCPVTCIKMKSIVTPIDEVLFEILPLGIVDSIELHAVGDYSSAILKWREIELYFNGVMSLCVDRSCYSDKEMKSLFTEILLRREPYTTIIQADGFPMGASNTLDSTLQALAIGQIVNRMNLPIFLLLSGGTNQYTEKYAAKFNIDYDGVSYGTYARNLVEPFIKMDDLFENGLLNKAIEEIINYLGTNI